MKSIFPLKTWIAVACVLFPGMWLSNASIAGVITFGSGGNQFNMEFVAIRDAGNDADHTGAPDPAGSVAYDYSMGKFEVSRDMINKANAIGSLGITLADMTSFGGNGIDRPATGVTWNEAARFVNWLNTSTGGFAAYKFTTSNVNENISLWTPADTLDYGPNNPYRSRRTGYVLPSMDEWYKAAFYHPNSGVYFNFPNGSDTAPTAVISGDADNTAVYGLLRSKGPADIMSAGGLSPYGIMGLGGNVAEWGETAFPSMGLLSGSSARGARGGYWHNGSSELSSLTWFPVLPGDGDIDLGFRVASLTVVPEPSSWVLTLMGISALLYRRRMRK